MFLVFIQHSVAAQSRKVPLLIENVNARLGWVRLEAERKARGCMYLLKGNTT